MQLETSVYFNSTTEQVCAGLLFECTPLNGLRKSRICEIHPSWQQTIFTLRVKLCNFYGDIFFIRHLTTSEAIPESTNILYTN